MNALTPSVVEWVRAIAAGSVVRTAATAARASAIRWRRSGKSSKWPRPTRARSPPSRPCRRRLGRQRPDRPRVQVDPGAERRERLADGGQALGVRREGGDHGRIIPTMSGLARPEHMATTEWLAEQLDRPGVRVVDARWRPDGSAGAVYATGHIPGAVHVDWRADLVDESDNGRRPPARAPGPGVGARRAPRASATARPSSSTTTARACSRPAPGGACGRTASSRSASSTAASRPGSREGRPISNAEATRRRPPLTLAARTGCASRPATSARSSGRPT